MFTARVMECFKVAYFSGKEIVRLYRCSRLILAAAIQAAAYFHSYKCPPNNSNLAGLKIISFKHISLSYFISWVSALIVLLRPFSTTSFRRRQRKILT